MDTHVMTTAHWVTQSFFSNRKIHLNYKKKRSALSRFESWRGQLAARKTEICMNRENLIKQSQGLNFK